MRLDFIAKTGVYTLSIPRKNMALVRQLMGEQGLNFSNRESTVEEAVLFTREPYAAVPFYAHATPSAAAQLLEMQTHIDASYAIESQAHIDCPADQELSPFQKAGVEYSLHRQNTLIGDEPGLGKTMQAICLANEMKAKRVLVLCPANIRLQWATKIRQWSTMAWPFHVYPILKGAHGVHPTAAWTVVSYDLARTPAIRAALLEGYYDLLVLDEAHYLKTVVTHRTRAVFGGGADNLLVPLASRAAATLALSGTPLPNRPREAYTLARGLCFDSIDFMSEESFRRRFNPSLLSVTEEGKTFIDERSGRHGELGARLRANFMVRRHKRGERGVMNQLKLPEYDIIRIEEDGPLRAALAAERMLDIDPESLPGPDDPVWGEIATVRRMMGVAMAPHAAEFVEMCLIGGEEKLIVFGHHIQVLDIIEKRLKRYGVIRIDGRTGASRKQLLVNQFCADPSVRVCLGNLLSMGTGTDGLQAVASHAIFAEADWTPGVNQQGVDRLDRMGQGSKVQADFLVAPKSFAERILSRALEKNQVIHETLDKSW